MSANNPSLILKLYAPFLNVWAAKRVKGTPRAVPEVQSQLAAHGHFTSPISYNKSNEEVMLYLCLIPPVFQAICYFYTMISTPWFDVAMSVFVWGSQQRRLLQATACDGCECLHKHAAALSCTATSCTLSKMKIIKASLVLHVRGLIQLISVNLVLRASGHFHWNPFWVCGPQWHLIFSRVSRKRAAVSVVLNLAQLSFARTIPKPSDTPLPACTSKNMTFWSQMNKIIQWLQECLYNCRAYFAE